MRVCVHVRTNEIFPSVTSNDCYHVEGYLHSQGRQGQHVKPRSICTRMSLSR